MGKAYYRYKYGHNNPEPAQVIKQVARKKARTHARTHIEKRKLPVRYAIRKAKAGTFLQRHNHSSKKKATQDYPQTKPTQTKRNLANQTKLNHIFLASFLQTSALFFAAPPPQKKKKKIPPTAKVRVFKTKKKALTAILQQQWQQKITKQFSRA